MYTFFFFHSNILSTIFSCHQVYASFSQLESTDNTLAFPHSWKRKKTYVLLRLINAINQSIAWVTTVRSLFTSNVLVHSNRLSNLCHSKGKDSTNKIKIISFRSRNAESVFHCRLTHLNNSFEKLCCFLLLFHLSFFRVFSLKYFSRLLAIAWVAYMHHIFSIRISEQNCL